MCFITAKEFDSRGALHTAVLTMAVAIGLNGLVGLLQTTTGMFTEWSLLGAAKEENRQVFGEGEISRASGFWGMANAFGWYLVTFLPVLLSILVLRVEEFRGWKGRLFAACSCLAVIALTLSYARGSWIFFCWSLLALAALAYRTLPRSERGRFVLRVAAVTLLVAMLCLPFAGPIYLRLTEDDRGSAYSRVPLMLVALNIIADNPWLGVGPANYEAEMRRYDDTPERITDEFDWPVHNIFLHMTAEAGIPVMLCFLTLITIALGCGWRALKSRDPLLRAIAVGLSVGMFAYLGTGVKELGSIGSQQLRLFFFFCGLLVALDRARRREEGALTGG
jgi:O-antigen ligase